MKKFPLIIVAVLICFVFFGGFSTYAAAEYNANYYSGTDCVIVNGNVPEGSEAIPVNIWITQSNTPAFYDILYLNDFIVENSGDFQYLLPVNLDDYIEEDCYAGVSVGGKIMEFVSVNNSYPLVCDNIEIIDDILYISGEYVHFSEETEVEFILKSDVDNLISTSTDADSDSFEYSFEVDLGNVIDYGFYTIVLQAGQYSIELPFEYLDIEMLFDKINSVKNSEDTTIDYKAAEIKTLLNSERNKISLQLNDFTFDKNINLENADIEIYKIFSCCIKDIETVTELRDELLKAYFTYLYNGASDLDEYYNIICVKAKDVLDFTSLKSYEYLKEDFTPDEQLAIFNAVKTKNLKYYDDVISDVCGLAVTKIINSAVYGSDIKKTVTDNPDVFGEVKSLSNSGWAYVLDMIPFDNIDDVIDAIEEYDEPLSGSPSPGPGPSGSPGGGVSMSAKVDNTPLERDRFADLTGFEWAKTAINALSDAGIVNGKTKNTFAPGDNVTREEFVKMLTGLVDSEGLSQIVDFTDADKTAWYYQYIVKAYNLGIITGKTDGTFGIGEYITRQDAAVMAYRTLGLKLSIDEHDTVINFNDNSNIADYALDAVTKMAGAKLLNGTGDGNFAPLECCTRAQAAQIIYNIYSAINTN